MSFKFPDLSSLQQTLQQTSQQLQQSLQDGIQTSLKEASTINDSLSPLFKRTTRSLQERFGGTNDISELPREYIELEKKVDSLKVFYKKTLVITSQYEIESYDYPPNIRESFQDVTKTFSEKIHGLSQATTTAEAEAVLTSSSATVQVPKTFAHSLSKTLKSNRETVLAASSEEETGLSKALLLIADAQYKIGDERLEQDKLIISEFNNKIKNILDNEFTATSKDRRSVENSRLTFDTLRAEIKAFQNGDDTVEAPEALQKKLEAAEDELVNATEVAVESMKKLISPTASINLLKVFSKIQLNYHKTVAEQLTTLVDQLEALPADEDKD
ncbi:unnamed protein product [Kuraishia capsulata CBS 1993]|uniref:BAR domain-containing protein n=1 Tax=Kuraishia capsulata CBS 1993 TaxID=1382522 RepID=W6MHW6_9ASCO|nr:uncharacterized protein KUCA_T00001920001 [Kuraishia capsulata CBS 1993]CDK25949.1 unnamed protein product [Kuraishia capsulata CBS 1993]